MKEQDYIRIMNRISDKHIEEAVSWDASEQKNRRSIRRLRLGVGAIAASLAIVIGGIGYGAYRDSRTANPGEESSGVSEEQLNLFGGHGKLTGYLSNNYTTLFRDDDNYYLYHTFQHSYDQWAISGSTGLQRIAINPDIPDETGTGGPRQTEKELNLLTDGERLYTYRDGKLYITDGCGTETEFMSVPWNPIRIQHLGGDYYFLMTNIEDSWIDGNNPQPYILAYVPDGEQPPIMQFMESGDVRPDGKGEHIYLRKENKIYRTPIQAPNHTELLTGSRSDEDSILDWTVYDDMVLSFSTANNAILRSNPAGEETQEEMIYPLQDDILPEYWYLGKQQPEYFAAQYPSGADGLTFRVLAGIPFRDSEEAASPDTFSVSAAELWGDDLPDTGERPDMDFFDTETHIIFTLPKDGINGEQLVQLDRATGESLYLGENYAPEQPKTDTQQEDTPAPETVPQEDSGFCSPNVFSLYYIPQEHLDSDSIECYRMLPAVKASEAHFDADVLSKTLPQGGGFIPDPNKNPHITIDKARDIILNSGDPSDTSAIYLKFSEAANGYAGKYPYESIGRVCYEFWLADDGSEFITAMCSYANEQEIIEYVYFRYDADAGQYAYRFIPERTHSNASADANAERNALGGKGKIRCYQYEPGCGLAEDDAYYYDITNGLRAPKTGSDTNFEKLSIPNIPQYNPEAPGRFLFVEDGMVMTVLDGELCELHPDGSRTGILKLTKDKNGNPIDSVSFSEVSGFAYESGRPTKLFVRGAAHITGREGDDSYYYIYAILDLKTGEFFDLNTGGYVIEWKVTDHAVYAAGWNLVSGEPISGDYTDDKYELIKFTDSPDPVPVNTESWRFGGLIGSVIDDDGYFWLSISPDQRVKADPKDGSFTPVSDEEYDRMRANIRGTGKSVFKENDPQRIVFSNPDGSGEIVLKEGKDYPTQRYNLHGAYSENGIIHIAVSEYDEPDMGAGKQVSEIIYTIDGDSVSSCKISFPDSAS